MHLIIVHKFSSETLFKFKDSLNINIKSHVVYDLNCMDCTASYVGVTTHVLPARVRVHCNTLKGVSVFSSCGTYNSKRPQCRLELCKNISI